ncbi:MAG: hypothetical protein WHS45_07475 [Anaerolinea sp.]
MNLRLPALLALLLIFFLVGAIIAVASEGGDVQFRSLTNPNTQTMLQPQITPAPVTAEAAVIGAPTANWWENLRRWLGLTPH